MAPINALDALVRLKQGNRRFVSDTPDRRLVGSPSHKDVMPDNQEPMAIILGCSDSRVPAEFVFDQGMGDLFVIRVAGNIVAPSQVGSVEFAAERFNTKLVVVLGHSNCGAVSATLEELNRPSEVQSPDLRAIVERIRPSIEPVLTNRGSHDDEYLLARAVRENIRASANHLRQGSEILERLIKSEGMLVVGAEYSLQTGKVDFFDGMPANSRL
jgi:carbonic anhydrase